MEFQARYFEELSLSQLYEILKSRMEVFMLEQQIHCLDMDDVDYRSRHCFLEDGGRVVAYLRAFYQADDPDSTVRLYIWMHKIIFEILTENYGGNL